MGIPNQYVQRVNGFFIEVIPVNSFAGPQSSGNLVALNASGYVDPSLVYSIAGGVITSINGLTGAIIISGGQNVYINASGQVVVINASGSGVGGSDLATRPCSFIPGQPAPGQEVMAYTVETAETFPINFASPQSYGTCRVSPVSGAQIYTAFKNGTNVGTISISTAGIFTFATAGGTQITLNAGDRFSVVAPGAIDPAIQGVSFTLVGTRIAIPTGAAPPIITWRGAYNGSITYSPFDMVSYLGSSYVCIAVSTGNLPTNTSFWNLVAQAGAAGATFGVQSVNGITGAVIISGGNNVSVTQVGQTVVISASGGGSSGGGAGALTLLGTFNASAQATLDIVTRNAVGQSGTVFQSDFDDYIIRIVNLLPVINGDAGLNLRVSTNGGTSYDATSGNYDYSAWYTYNNGNGNSNIGTGGPSTELLLAGTSVDNSLTGVCGSLELFNPLSATLHKAMHYNMSYVNTGVPNMIRFMGSGRWKSTTAVNAIRLLYSSGNIASGSVRVYGVAH